MNAFWVMDTRDSHAGKPINSVIWVFCLCLTWMLSKEKTSSEQK